MFDSIWDKIKEQITSTKAGHAFEINDYMDRAIRNAREAEGQILDNEFGARWTLNKKIKRGHCKI